MCLILPGSLGKGGRSKDFRGSVSSLGGEVVFWIPTGGNL